MKMFTSIFAWVDRLFNKHMLVRRLIIFIFLALVAYGAFKTFNHPALNGGNVVTAFGLITGMAAGLFGLYKYMRDKDGD